MVSILCVCVFDCFFFSTKVTCAILCVFYVYFLSVVVIFFVNINVMDRPRRDSSPYLITSQTSLSEKIVVLQNERTNGAYYRVIC